jgi:hypothetical protein
MVRPRKKRWFDKLACIQYAGVAGCSADCQEAVVRFLHHDRITKCRIFTSKNHHCLLLTINTGDLVAVKSGFASGYGGEGPHTFSYVLQLLDAHKVEIDEVEVDEEFLDRVDASALTRADMKRLERARPARRRHWNDYIEERHWGRADDKTLWQDMPTVIPFGIIDPRLIDLALTFRDGPDQNLLLAYRRLEDVVRERTGLRDHGARLFSLAFHGDNAVLRWPDVDDGERAGRAQLFTGTYQAHRNPRAHRQPKNDWSESQVCELLLLNQLFRLEAASVMQAMNTTEGAL